LTIAAGKPRIKHQISPGGGKEKEMSRYARKVDETKFKLSEENAHEAVMELLGYYEIDPARSDPEQEKILDEFLDRLAFAYRRGNFENKHDDKKGFTVIQHLQNGETVTYRELAGSDRVFMEGSRNAYEKCYAILGRTCGYGSAFIEKLKGEDWKAAEALAFTFFQY
jgi:hypothetical protein